MRSLHGCKREGVAFEEFGFAALCLLSSLLFKFSLSDLVLLQLSKHVAEALVHLVYSVVPASDHAPCAERAQRFLHLTLGEVFFICCQLCGPTTLALTIKP